jgi:ribosomal protein L40E
MLPGASVRPVMDDAPPTAVCRLCGEALPEGAQRCRSCSLPVQLELSRRDYWRLGAGVLVIYLLTALALILTR